MTNDNHLRCFVAVPTYNGWVSIGTMTSILTATAGTPIKLGTGANSILPDQFNKMWLAGLESGADWFAMIHADIQAEPLWLDKLIDIANTEQAEVVSCVVPIKSDENLYSTGLGQPNKPVHFRLTGDHLAKLPQTFDGATVRRTFDQAGHLAVNTGCWVARLNQPWNTNVCFRFRTRVDYVNGITQVLPEDWDFSGQLAEMGLRYLATRAVRISHFGETQWTNKIDQPGRPGRTIDLGMAAAENPN